MIRTILIPLFLLSSFLGYSQNSWTINPKMGIQSLFLYDNPPNTSSNGKLGYEVDVLARYGQNFYGTTGLEWNQTRTSLSGTGTTGSVDIQAITFPLILGYGLSDYSDLKPRIYGGTSWTIITSINENFEGIEKNDFKKSIFGLRGGIGLDLIIFTFDLEYEHSVSSLLKDFNNTSYGRVKFTLGILLQ